MISPDHTCYISGPMTGLTDLNYPAFHAMEKLLRDSFGCNVLNPARQPNGLAYEEYMKLAFADLERATVIVLLDEWENSPGAKREFLQAHQRGIGIVFQEQIELLLTRRLARWCNIQSIRKTVKFDDYKQQGALCLMKMK